MYAYVCLVCAYVCGLCVYVCSVCIYVYVCVCFYVWCVYSCVQMHLYVCVCLCAHAYPELEIRVIAILIKVYQVQIVLKFKKTKRQLNTFSQKRTGLYTIIYLNFSEVLKAMVSKYHWVEIRIFCHFIAHFLIINVSNLLSSFFCLQQASETLLSVTCQSNFLRIVYSSHLNNIYLFST